MSSVSLVVVEPLEGHCALDMPDLLEHYEITKGPYEFTSEKFEVPMEVHDVFPIGAEYATQKMIS